LSLRENQHFAECAFSGSHIQHLAHGNYIFQGRKLCIIQNKAQGMRNFVLDKQVIFNNIQAIRRSVILSF